MKPAHWLDPDDIQRHSLDRRQFIDFRQATLTNGLRIVEAYNSSGLHFTLLPDRGLDIWQASYNGMPLTWIAPGSPHPPDYGQSWLEQFNGGLLTTCGLTHVGPPEDDRDIHGKFSRLQASTISVESATQTLSLRGKLHQSSLFGEQFSVERTYTMHVGEPAIHLHDTITNNSDEPVPFMALYHCNIGYPMIRKATQLLTASTVYPRDTIAKAGLATWQNYDSASAGYAEQVFFHHTRVTPDDSMQAQVLLANNDIGLAFTWDTRHMPYLTQWKNTRQGIYVCGIEPGNCIPEGQNAAREAQRLVMLEPGESHDFDLMISVKDGKDAIQDARQHIDYLRKDGIPAQSCHFTGYAGGITI